MKTRLILCIAALLFIELAGGFFHDFIVPPRWTMRDWGMILPLLLCIGVGVTVRDPIRRAVFGLAQGLVFLDVYSNWFRRNLAFDTDPEYYALLDKLLAAVVTYGIAFTLLTAQLRRLLIRTRPPDSH